jgi:2-(1,2-epoxy-1,2-dihydrophenyl)acetyl-CoA isomerase
MPEFVHYQQRGRVVILTLDAPDSMNAFSSQEDCDALVAAALRAAQDPGVSAIILTGAGKAFSAGGNVKNMLAGNRIGRAETALATRDHYRKAIQSIPRTLWEIEKPIIAAVNGAAVGAGCDLATACDIRVASPHAKFASSFVKLGLISGDGGCWLLPRVVGFSKAAEMAFTGDTLDAEQALQCGLVSAIVPADELLEHAYTLAARIAVNPLPALRLTKRLLRESQHTRLPDMLELSAAYQALLHETDDHREAVTAFIEKRTPVFTHK